MKFTTIAVVAAFTGATHATPAKRDHIPALSGTYNVTGLDTHSTPHSSWAICNFTVSVNPSASPITCHGEVNSYQHIGSISTTPCSDPSVAFNLTRNNGEGTVKGGSATLKVFWQFAKLGQYIGKYEIPAEQIQSFGENTSVYEKYTGPGSFEMKDMQQIDGYRWY